MQRLSQRRRSILFCHLSTRLEGVVRFDLINMTQTDKDTRTIKAVGSVAMSVPVLLRSYTELSGVLSKLVEQGIVKKTEAPVLTPLKPQPATAPEAA